MTIVDRIKLKCKENGKSLSSIEAECGLGHATIRRWNENSPAIEKAQDVANLLQVSLDWLITGKESGDLTEEEQQLVDTFRGCSSTGKLLIQEHAESIRKTLPAEPEDQNAGVSTSAIG